MAKLDILIPAKNEAGNLPTLLERISRICTKAKIDYRVIIVDDHSTDNSLEILEKLKEKYPLEVLTKRGKSGKAFSIFEAAEVATTEYVLMIDADLQYPPEAISEMIKLTPSHGVVIAERSTQKTSFIRQLLSKANRYLLGKFILGIDCDAQSGMKLFRRSILTHLDPKEVNAWAIDMPLLYTALELGLTIGSVNIEFAERTNGHSKVNLFKTTKEILWRALKLKFKSRKVYHLPSASPDNMIGAGVIHRRRKYITHTHLHHEHSAIITLHRWQKVFLLVILGIFLLGFDLNATETTIIFVALLTFIYFLDVFFNLFLVLKSLHFPPELSFSPEDLAKINSKNLPVYSILCPLYHEAKVLPAFVESINNFDYPKDKLDVLLLLEEDDTATIEAAKSLNLPKHFRTIIVPHSQPKTKPKACNYGLSLVKGDYVVIYDAEDRPDPDQLKKAILGFQDSPPNITCLQAKLNYYNPHHNLLTRLFTTEYSLWFDITLPGLQSISTTIPLGGTSNHFRTQILKDLHGWDSFNVTEDCDLGARLFKLGFQTAIIDSTTLEEANSHLGNWIRQRSRWIKGYMQTYLVHNRHPLKFIRSHGIHAFIFQLIVGGKIAFMLINPILWLMTLSYFLLYKIVGPTIETLYPSAIFYMAVFSMIFGNFLFLYYYMIGCAKRGHYELIKYVYLIPFYWIAISVAAVKALYQLIVKPHFWEKTHHGLHLKQETATFKVKTERFSKIKNLSKSNLFNGGSLIFATVIANFFNFLYNAYLSRAKNISIEEFGLISLIGSLLYIVQIPSQALSRTVTYRSAYLLGQKKIVVGQFWRYIRNRIIPIAIFATGLWLIISPFLPNYFHSNSLLPFLFFSPIWTICLIGSIDRGFLSGNHKFSLLAIITVVEAISKLIFTIIFVSLNLTQLVYTTIPLSMGISYLIGWYSAKTLSKGETITNPSNLTYFPKRFFATSILVKISSIAFLSLDVIFAKMFLSATEAGQYALISLVGKIVYLIGSLFSQFITPVVSKAEGAETNSRRPFYQLLFITTLSSLAGFVGVGVFSRYTVPFLFGPKTIPILDMLFWYSLSMVAFTVSNNIVNYHQVRRQYFFPVLGLFISGIQILAMTIFHKNIFEFVQIMSILGLIYLFISIVSHLFYEQLKVIFQNTSDFIGLFTALLNGKKPTSSQQLRILILNWRDTRHVWAGGAEVYLQELAKRWVKDGHHVTIFCGNDGHNPKNERVDGVNIIRRGGLFTVYIWAILYYLLRFRGRYDIIIDSENGIPFFTPLFTRLPTFLLIYHIHSDLFRSGLYFPMDKIALFLESKIMPVVYRNSKVITISESSRQDIISLGNFKPDNICIINPGIDPLLLHTSSKTKYPSFVYLGRLRPQKNVNLAIGAFAKVVKKCPNSKLFIAGWGDQIDKLKRLSQDLQLEHAVKFLGRISETKKSKLLGKSWAMLQPSSIEGWGITVIEANACGTTVIASDIPGLRDSVLNNVTGILVRPNDQDALSRSIISINYHPQYRKRLSLAAINWAKNFDWDIQSQKFLSTIKNYHCHDKNYQLNLEPALIKQTV